jgi:hypothetical protein
MSRRETIMTEKVENEVASSAAIASHLEEVLASHAFKGSRRSQEFLRYVVEKSLSREFEALKERVLGVEIFGRPLTYDTSADSIVRVTANDVRKRLVRYYESEGASASFRIQLPSGTYVPEIRQPQLALSALPIATPTDATQTAPSFITRPMWGRIISALVVGALLGGVIATLSVEKRSQSALRVAPWSTLFQASTQTQLIFCDASLEMLDEYLHRSVSLSDYANRKLLPDLSTLSADARRAAGLLGGADFTVTTAPVDLGISMRISELAQAYGQHLKVRSARDLHFRDFKADGNFILLGSPRSNPWTSLFQDELDFYFSFDAARNREVCRNVRPKPGELSVYVPTAQGGATGEAFAIAAFIGNSDQSGHVVILAGSNAEGTEAAARFVTDLPMLSKTLRRYGLDPARTPLHFEALLRLTTMAGSPNRFEVIALHALDGTSKQ